MRQAAMPFILATVLIDMIAIGLIVPVLPLIVGTFTASPAEQAFWFGVVTFTFGAANFFASTLADSSGRSKLTSELAIALRIDLIEPESISFFAKLFPFHFRQSTCTAFAVGKSVNP